MGARQKRWTEAQVRALGVRTTVPIAGEILGGLSATQAYLLHQRGGFPVPVLQVGRRLVVPTAPVLALLGLEGGDRDRPPSAGQQVSAAVAGPGPQMSEAGPAPPGPATTNVETSPPKEAFCAHRTPLHSARGAA